MAKIANLKSNCILDTRSIWTVFNLHFWTLNVWQMHHYSAGTLHLFACIMCNTHCVSIAGCIFWTNHLSIDFFASLLNCPRCKLPATGEWSNLAHEISQRRHLWTQIRNILSLILIRYYCGDAGGGSGGVEVKKSRRRNNKRKPEEAKCWNMFHRSRSTSAPN